MGAARSLLRQKQEVVVVEEVDHEEDHTIDAMEENAAKEAAASGKAETGGGVVQLFPASGSGPKGQILKANLRYESEGAAQRGPLSELVGSSSRSQLPAGKLQLDSKRLADRGALPGQNAKAAPAKQAEVQQKSA